MLIKKIDRNIRREAENIKNNPMQYLRQILELKNTEFKIRNPLVLLISERYIIQEKIKLKADIYKSATWKKR